jgi:hypothetical protein
LLVLYVFILTIDKKIRKEDAVSKTKAKLDEVTAALAEATKQEQDEEKKHADAEAGFIMFVVSSEALGIVSRCRFHPATAAVAQRGLFRILLGSGDVVVRDVGNKDLAGYCDIEGGRCSFDVTSSGSQDFAPAEQLMYAFYNPELSKTKTQDSDAGRSTVS